MTQTEASRLALEALDWCVAEINRDSPSVINANKAITAIKAALEAKDEPDHSDELTIAYMSGLHRGKEVAQRTWVGLSDEEASEIGQQANRFDWLTDYSEAIDFVIEATTTKLKDKNHD